MSDTTTKRRCELCGLPAGNTYHQLCAPHFADWQTWFDAEGDAMDWEPGECYAAFLADVVRREETR